MDPMYVNTNGTTICAHESLSLEQIVFIILSSNELKHKLHAHPWHDFKHCHDFYSYLECLQHSPHKLVRTRGRDPEKHRASLERAKEMAKTPVVCECGSVISRGSFKRHQDGNKHKHMMEEKNNLQI